MPVDPHPVQVTVKKSDNSTAAASCKYWAKNVTKGSNKSTVVICNASGIGTLDLANLPKAGTSNPYDVGDEILMVVWQAENGQTYHDAYVYTVTGTSSQRTMYLNSAAYIEMGINESCKIWTMDLDNTDNATHHYVKIRDIATGQEIYQAGANAYSGHSVTFGGPGLQCAGGFILERESQVLKVSVHTG